MGWFDRFRRRKVKQTVERAVRSALRGFSSGKQTQHRWEQQFGWYENIIKRSEYRQKNVMETLRIIRDINPDASMAIWNFLRLANNGHELECLNMRGDPDKEGLELLNDLAKRVGKLYGGGMDQLLNVLLLTGYTQGAIALEVELNESLDDVVDFHAVDPSSVEFRRNNETGEMELVQKQIDGRYKVLNPEQVFYYPFDPDIGDPYGRSPILPVLQIVFFQVEVLKDLKAVVHHQGHARFDISVVEEAIMKNIPPTILNQGQEAVVQFVESYIAQIQQEFSRLNPDDDFFHTDSVKVDMVGGTNGRSMDVTKIIDVINQQIVTSLKQLPILLGRNEGTTETHGTIQWQIYVAGIESIQRGVKRLLERAYNVALQVYGRQGSVRLKFDSLRTTDRLKEAQAEEVETRTKITQVQQGWITNDEAALEMVGHSAAGEPQVPSLGIARQRSRHTAGKRAPKTRAEEDEYVKEIPVSWASDVAELTTRAGDTFYSLLQSQLDFYLERLRNAPEMPTRALVDIERMRVIHTREDQPEPPPEFIEWVVVNILTASGEQLELWTETGLTWMEQAAILAGQATLFELDVDIDFDHRDEGLLRWLTNRANDAAELIQSVTDREVIMTLWDVAYEGNYTIVKFADALQESHAFSRDRAVRIARTEVLNAARAGQYHADKQSGIVIGKQWMSAHQPNTRDGHREADGQIRAFDEPFHVMNADGQVEMLMFPGDTSLGASASNIINCRCWYKRILQGEEDLLKGGE
ncbi:phage minor head protein [Aneurinibacillus thermoaerophilus]|uniref:phage minor head protein n=1 Tax=Aneurinibacillus thermoaerophilus TaxID=143495 RepID=UPI002E1D9CA2|nr:phage minor head protein [Aneurinibacillus thermoaerophilus]